MTQAYSCRSRPSADCETSTAARAAAPLAAAPRPRQEPTAGQPAQETIPQGQPFSTSLYTSLCAAIKTAAAAETYAQQIGRPVAFDTADIRAMAATLFIHATGGGR